MFRTPLSSCWQKASFIGLILFFQIWQAQSQTMDASPNIFLKIEVIPDTLYVQAQFIYILRVYSLEKIECSRFYEIDHEPFGCEQSSELYLDRAKAEKLGDIKILNESHQEHTYKVYEQRYAIFPEQSGILEIPAVIFRGKICQNICSDFFNPPKKIEQHFSKHQVKIQSQPVKFPNDTAWLPAQDFTLTEAWNLNSADFKVGEPVTLTLTMRAKGLKAEQLPQLQRQNLEGIHFYSKSSQLQNRFENGWLIGEKQQTIDLIPKKLGSYTLAEIKIPWWDTVNQLPRYAMLPAHSIEIRGLTGNKWQIVDLAKMIQRNYWFWLSMSLMVIWLITLIAWWKQRQQQPFLTSPTTDNPAQPNLRTASKKLKQACKQNDPYQAKQALLEWATIRWSDKPMYNLGNIADQFSNTEAKTALKKLDKVLYAPKEIVWEGQAFWQVMSKNLLDKASTGKVKIYPLPALYPKS